MAQRRYAHYLPGDREPPPDRQKPAGQGPQPSRAWLERADEDGGPPAVWHMTVEHKMESATSHAGSFAELVRLAAESEVTEYYYVWSSEVRVFVLRSQETVMQQGA